MTTIYFPSRRDAIRYAKEFRAKGKSVHVYIRRRLSICNRPIVDFYVQ